LSRQIIRHCFPTRRSSDLINLDKMSDIKKINRKFITLITTFASIALLSIAGVVLAWIYIEDENTRFFVIVIPIIILLISSTWFKDRKSTRLNSSHVKISYA